MSRLLVSRLPPSTTAGQLQSHFSPLDLPITDVKVLHKRDGTPRRMGFIGFKDEKDAERAMQWGDGTWFQVGSVAGAGGRIRVEIAKAPKDAPPPKKFTFASQGDQQPTGTNSTDAKAQTTVDPKGKGKSKEEDPRFKEFLEVMGDGRKKRPASALDEEPPQTGSGRDDPKVNKKKRKEVSQDRDEPPVPSTSKPQPIATDEPPTFSHPMDLDADGEEVERDATVMDDTISDMEYLARRKKRKIGGDDEADEKLVEAGDKAWEQDEEDGEGTGDGGNVEVDDEQMVEAKDPAEEDILSNGRLFIRNLPFTATEEELNAAFRRFGHISQVHLVLNPSTHSSRGLAYVLFASPPSALQAYKEMDKSSFQGRILHVLPAVDRNPKTDTRDSSKRATLKDEKMEQKKGEAGKGFNWSSLYMNSDAVMSSVADRLKISKSELLDPESDNAAVRLAMAETHIIQETKAFFENEGIKVAAFAGGGRSQTTILCKNIPYGTSEATLRSLFSPHGEISRILIPPAGTMAVVEMAHPEEAKAAFRSLAYKRIGNSVMYLEKGPMGMFEGAPKPKVAPGPAAAGPSVPTTTPATSAQKVGTAEDENVEEEGEPGSTLFVKNLNFATTSERLAESFKALSSFLFARVQTKPDPKRAGARLSMGFGFVGFRTVDAAKIALKVMDGYSLDGYNLRVQFAQRGKEDDESAATKKGKKDGKSNKLVVKNLPFEASKKEIRELFSAYGTLKSVRLPKKFDHSTRGFAFLEFVSQRDAENAMAALTHSHLLGRHLVVQYAEDKATDIDELRAKMAGEVMKTKLPFKRDKFIDIEDVVDDQQAAGERE